MKRFIELYGVAVATGMMGKTTDDEISKYLGREDEREIALIKELQPVLMDFGVSETETMKKINEICRKYGFDELP
ncbi:MAG: hypothetical protein J6D15_02380 [Clostridia bacterium]|nr:hypothetical protein [Clostridia bacterium]